MSRIHGKNTKPEIIVRKYLYSRGIRYRLHTKLPGKPDIVIKSKGIVIFVNGCFWHAHNCPAFRLPKTRSDFWKTKIEANKARDIRNEEALNKSGWRVLTIWECELNELHLNTLTESLIDPLKRVK